MVCWICIAAEGVEKRMSLWDEISQFLLMMHKQTLNIMRLYPTDFLVETSL